jgi:hypothetical protein
VLGTYLFTGEMGGLIKPQGKLVIDLTPTSGALFITLTNRPNKVKCLPLAALFSLVQCKSKHFTREEHLKDASLRYSNTLLTNIRLGWQERHARNK